MIFKLSAILACICFVQVHCIQPNGTTCGETIQISDDWQAGYISYKPDETYSANERCVWTIRVAGSRTTVVHLVQSGINGADPDERISVGAFRHGASTILGSNQFIRNTTTSLTFTEPDILIVTFVSGSAPAGTGFVLSYNATKSTGHPSNKSIDFISSSANGTLTHPEVGDYDNMELSTFIFAPTGFNVNSAPTLHTEWRRIGTGNNCQDVVMLFKFYPDIGWSQYDSYCRSMSVKTASHTDMLLMVFKTDASAVTTGFKITWNTD